MNTLTNLSELVKMTQGCEKVKLYDTYPGQYIKFFNGRIWEVQCDPDTYNLFYAYLLAAKEWAVKNPAITSAGWVFEPTDAIPFEGEPVGQVDEQIVTQAQINRAAQERGATHVHMSQPVYYRKSASGIEVCEFEPGQGFTQWRQDYHYHMPEWAGVIL